MPPRHQQDGLAQAVAVEMTEGPRGAFCGRTNDLRFAYFLLLRHSFMKALRSGPFLLPALASALQFFIFSRCAERAGEAVSLAASFAWTRPAPRTAAMATTRLIRCFMLEIL